MKHIFKLLVLAVAAFLMLGCMDMLTTNIFSGVDTPSVPSVEDIGTMENEELLDTVGDLIESDSFYEDIAAEIIASTDGTSETKDAIVENLNEVFAPDSTAPLDEQQDAALLVAEIELNTTAAGDVVDAFVNVATGFIDTPPDTTDTAALAEEIMGAVFADVTDSESFNATIDALLLAAAAYEFYGDSLVDDSGTVVVPDGDNIGAVAQDAIVAILVAEMLDPSTGLTAQDLEAFVLGETTTLPTFVIDDPFDPDAGNTALVNILEASGLGDAFGLGGTI